MDGNQVPQELVAKVGETFEIILQEVSHFSLSIVIRLGDKLKYHN